MDLKEVVRRLNIVASLNLAGSWDNVGLLVEPYTKKKVNKVLLTNDLTEQVMDETVNVKADLILSYHPPIFQALKRVTSDHWKERIVARCLEAGIAVYSPHTAYDAVKGGVNDWLVGAFGDAEVTVIQPSTELLVYTHMIMLSATTEQTKEQLQAKLICVPDAKLVMSDSGSAPYVLCCKKNLAECIRALSSCDVEFISKSESVPITGYGMGRFAVPNSQQTIADVVQRVKAMTGLGHVRLALAKQHNLNSIVCKGAVCAGSGLSVLKGVDADMIISGEMSHHDVLEFTQCSVTVLLLEHSNSERGFLSAVLQPKLKEIFENKITVAVSEEDKDPLQIV
uniref:NIF3-like protein 1 n=1 Tax=Hirondellea gigas TaxID=1518452 RepID=A0A2P2I6J9_9CRUS